VASSKNPAVVGDGVTFTASVSTSAGIPVSGYVIFRDGPNTLGSSALNAGVAAFTTDAMNTGAHSITAQFVSGDSDIAGCLSAELTQSVVNPPPDFSLTASPAAVSLAAGKGAVDGSTSAQVLLTITPGAGFTSTVDFTCVAMPQNEVSCRISPASVTPTGSPLSTVLQIGTNPLTASGPAQRATRLALAMLLPALGVVLVPLRRRRRCHLVLLSMVTLLVFANACGGGGDHPSTTRTATVVVTATATGGAPSHSANVVVSIAGK
jgi:hypothetical protein